MEEIEEWLTNNLERQGEALLLGRVLRFLSSNAGATSFHRKLAIIWNERWAQSAKLLIARIHSAETRLANRYGGCPYVSGAGIQLPSPG
jgi:hypothetical protein